MKPIPSSSGATAPAPGAATQPSSPWSGIFTALWTPTDAWGRLMESALQRHLEFLRSTALRGVMVLGSTGESVLLSQPARRQVMELVARYSGGLRKIAHVGEVNPNQAVELAQAARTLGFDAVSILPPWFFHLDEEDLLAHFVHVAKAAQLPVVLYNFPERTGHRLDPSLISRFADAAPLVAIKQSGGEFGYHKELVELGRRKGFVVFTGGDPRLAEAMELGVVGNIGGLSNFIPELMTGLYEAVCRRDTATVGRITEQLMDIDRLCGTVRFPWNMGAGVAARGFDAGAPKQILSPGTDQAWHRLVEDLQSRFKSWGLAKP